MEEIFTTLFIAFSATAERVWASAKAEVAGTDEIKFWIMSWGSKAVALSPKSLREEIQLEADMLLKNYRKKPSLKTELNMNGN